MDAHGGVILSADRILAHDDREYREVYCPEWGGAVRLRTLTAAELVDLLTVVASEQKPYPSAHAMVRAIRLSAVDSQNNPLFTEADEEKLLQRRGVAVERLFRAVWELNGLGGESLERDAKN